MKDAEKEYARIRERLIVMYDGQVGVEEQKLLDKMLKRFISWLPEKKEMEDMTTHEFAFALKRTASFCLKEDGREAFEEVLQNIYNATFSKHYNNGDYWDARIITVLSYETSRCYIEISMSMAETIVNLILEEEDD